MAFAPAGWLLMPIIEARTIVRGTPVPYTAIDLRAARLPRFDTVVPRKARQGQLEYDLA